MNSWRWGGAGSQNTKTNRYNRVKQTNYRRKIEMAFRPVASAAAGEEPNNTPAKGGGEKASREHSIEGSEKGWANQGEGGSVKFIGEAIQARGLIWGRFLDSGGELREGEGNLKAFTLGRGETGQANQKTRKVGRIRREGSPRVHRIRGVGGGGVAALEDSRVEGEDLLLNPSGIRVVVASGSRPDRLQAWGATMPPLGGQMEGTRLLLFHQWRMGAQGNPRRHPRVKASDLSVASLHRRPILGGERVGEARGEETARLPPSGGKKQGERAAKVCDEGFGCRFPPEGRIHWVGWAGGGDRAPGGGEGGEKGWIS
jgi:hypothetical protein